MDTEQVFTMTDGCLLSALIISGRKSTLKDIILIGDSINHAIFNFEDINKGLSRLEKEGYIFFKEKKNIYNKKNKGVS